MPATFTVTPLSPQWSLDVEAFKTTGTTVYQLIASEPTTLGAAVSALIADANGMKIGKTHPDTTGVPCRKLSPKFADGTRMLFVVTCEHDSTATAIENPLNADVEISSSSEQAEESFYFDETPAGGMDNGPNWASHTNGVPFSELPKRSRAIRVFEITKNVVPSTTSASVDALENKVNEAAVTLDGMSRTARTLLVSAVNLSAEQTLNGVTYKQLRSTIRYNDATWDQKYESLGVIDGNGQPIADADGNPVEKPWPLDFDGFPLASRDEPGFEILLRPYKTATLTPLL